jgi:hypothetical protein
MTIRLLAEVAVSAVLFGSLALSWYFGLRAMANRPKESTMLRDMVEGRRGPRGLLWTDFGSRTDFTETGWRYRNRALFLFGIALISLVGRWFI